VMLEVNKRIYVRDGKTDEAMLRRLQSLFRRMAIALEKLYSD